MQYGFGVPGWLAAPLEHEIASRFEGDAIKTRGHWYVGWIIGILAIHDIFENPAEGGQAPHLIWKLAQASGLFEPLALTRTLGALRKLD